MVAKIYGLYTVEVENMSPISLMIMPNLIMPVDDMNKMKYKFDLKGSKIGRKTLPLDIIRLNPQILNQFSQGVLKDVDFDFLQKKHKNLININT